ELILDVKLDHYPFYDRSGEITVSTLELFVNGHHDGNYVASIQLPAQPSPEDDIEIAKEASLNDTHYKEHVFTSPPGGTGEWRIKLRRHSDSDFTSLPPDDIEDVLVIIHFEIS
ncbi:MAG TPA: hypothetical protein VK074_03400, partial [Fodinibius sp.]|nr:hypothetical protein [Fodinibius sp.]